MYVSDQFIDWQQQLTHYRDPSTKLGFWVGRGLKRQKKRFKIVEKRQNGVAPIANDPGTKGNDKNVCETE